MERPADGEEGAREARGQEGAHRRAAEARERIRLVASWIAEMSGFRKPPTAVGRIAVISDTHLGDPVDSLTDPRMIEALTDALRSLGQIDELVLLGDIFDFWQSPINEALARGRDMMAALYMLENVKKMVFVPGNHDHHIFQQYYDEQEIRRLKNGEVDPPELFVELTDDCPAMECLKPKGARVPLVMAYPMYNATVRERKVVFTHGQLLGFFERSLWNPQNSMREAFLRKKNELVDIEDMERFASPYYELLTLSAYMPGVVSGRYRLYRWVSRTSKMIGVENSPRVSKYRHTSIEENVAEIEAFIDRLCPERPDYFVFGHIHKAGRLVLPVSGVTAVNAGCWLADRVHPAVRNNIVEIADDVRILHID